MENQEIIDNLKKALISWYSFRKDSRALFISGGFKEMEVLYEVLVSKIEKVDICSLEKVEKQKGEYDFICACGIIEKALEPVEVIRKLKILLKPEGKIILGAGNRLAIKHFCGDKDYFTGHVLDGLDNYAGLSQDAIRKNGGHLYSQAELKKILEEAGIKENIFYAVFPGIFRPQMLIREGYTPNEKLEVRVFSQYNSPETVFLDEEKIYQSLIDNNMLHQMANGYLIMCDKCDLENYPDQITVQGDRGENEAMVTLIKNDSYVIKRAMYSGGKEKIERLQENTNYLKKHDVNMVEARTQNDEFVMPYVKGEIATVYFQKLVFESIDEFKKELKNSQNI